MGKLQGAGLAQCTVVKLAILEDIFNSNSSYYQSKDSLILMGSRHNGKHKTILFLAVLMKAKIILFLAVLMLLSKIKKFQLSCQDLISSPSLSMKIQIMSRKITENLGFKSLLRKVKQFLSFFHFQILHRKLCIFDFNYF